MSVFSLRRLLSLFLLLAMFFSLALGFCSCGREKRDAYEMMMEFVSAYPTRATVYSPSLPEGDDGHAGENLLPLLYGDVSECVMSYAVLLSSGLDRVEEAAILICYTSYDAGLVADAVRGRISKVLSAAYGLDASAFQSASVIRKGRAVAMCALSDNSRAQRILSDLL